MPSPAKTEIVELGVETFSANIFYEHLVRDKIPSALFTILRATALMKAHGYQHLQAFAGELDHNGHIQDGAVERLVQRLSLKALEAVYRRIAPMLYDYAHVGTEHALELQGIWDFVANRDWEQTPEAKRSRQLRWGY